MCPVALTIGCLLAGIITVGQHESDGCGQYHCMLRIDAPVQVVCRPFQGDIAVIAQAHLVGHAPPLGNGEGQKKVEVGEAVLYAINIRLSDVGIATDGLGSVVDLYAVVAPSVSKREVLLALQQPRKLEVVAVVRTKGGVSLHDDIARGEVARGHQPHVAHALGTSC